MLLSTIDIGTNSVLMLVAETGDAGTMSVVKDVTRITRLGTGINNGYTINDAALQRTIEALREYLKTCADLNVDTVNVIGTEVFRCAENTREIQNKIKDLTGYTVEVLSPEEEAAYTFRAALPQNAEDDKPYIVIDIGGGSTEIVFGSPLRSGNLAQISGFAHSLPIGAVSLSERYLHTDPPTGKELDEMQAEIRAQLNNPGEHRVFGSSREGKAGIRRDLSRYSGIGVGGTLTTLAAIQVRMSRFDPAGIEGLDLSASEIASSLERLSKMPASSRLSLPGMVKGREDIITAGVAILLEFMHFYALKTITVSTKGVRYGYLISKMDRSKFPTG